MKPFVLLATRAEDRAADEEYAAFLRFGGLDEPQLLRVRLERDPLPDFEPGAVSGFILGGSPFTVSDPEETKSAAQRRVEADLGRLLDVVVARDIPFLGACYGVGTVGRHQGATVDATYAEPVGPVRVSLTEHGRRDPLFGVLPESFDAFAGHKEAISGLPAHAVHLATSAGCPVQGFRIGRNVYATQFHPELDVAGLHTRIDIYRHAGYFHPDEATGLKAASATVDTAAVTALTGRFVELYARG